MKRVLVIAAHPDDEVLGCGGTIAQHSQNNDKVKVVILGEGLTSRVNLVEKDKAKRLLRLKKSAERASKILGVSELIFHNLPDNKFDSMPFLDIVHLVEPFYKNYSPNIVYTHFSDDVNVDHRISNSIVEILTRPIPKSPANLILNFETPSSTEWNFTGSVFSPNYFNTISEKSLRKKIKALLEYKDEMRAFPHPRSIEYIKALATVRGGQSGEKFAEAFMARYIKN